MAFWGGVVPENLADLQPLWDYGVLGFKCFMVPSGVAEFTHVEEGDLRAAMVVLAKLGAPLLAHAESPAMIEAAARMLSLNPGAHSSYGRYLASRPDQDEVDAIRLLLRLAQTTGARTHIVHLATAQALPMIAQARQQGLPLTVETCPHYLYFSSEEIPDGTTAHKCAPPIRSAANREELWKALREGLIDMVVSDHSPSPSELKCVETGDFVHAWGGIASLQVSLPAVWTGAQRRGFSLPDVVRWMCQKPAELAGMGHFKGAIAEGYEADLVVFDPDATFVVDPQALRHRHKLTPYAGETLRGVVQSTFLAGSRIYHWGLYEGEPSGMLLRRPGSS
jgi:allantoinase